MDIIAVGKILATFKVLVSRAVGLESKAHPAVRIISSPDAERYLLPPTQGYQYHIAGNAESLDKANPQSSSQDCTLPDCSGSTQRGTQNHPRGG